MNWVDVNVIYPVMIGLAILGVKFHPVYKFDCSKIKTEIKTMSDTVVMDYGDFNVMLPPHIYCVGEMIDNIFAVPENNAVGTNDIDNAISVLHFKPDNQVDRKIVKKDFMEMVTGPFDFYFMPVLSNEEIAYSQSKGFLLVNISHKKVDIYSISRGIYDADIGSVALLNKQTNAFVFEMRERAGEDDRKILKVIQFEKDSFKVIAEHPAGKKTFVYSEPWFVYQNLIFIYDNISVKINAFDQTFQSIAHPICEAFNSNSKNFRRLIEIAVHPSMPFALLWEAGKLVDPKIFDALPSDSAIKLSKPLYAESGRSILYLFRWTHPDPKQRLIPLLSATGSIWNSYNPNYMSFTFSPDGKWLVFRDATQSSKNPIFVAVPINESNPLYLGKPIKLGNAMREDAIGPTGTAWSTNPTAFVMCDGAILYKWDLGDFDKLQKQKMPPNSPEPFKKIEE